MSHYYVVHMPIAEARHLAGVGRAPANGGPGASPASRPAGDQEPGLAEIPAAGQPVRGPFVPDQHGIVPPGRVEYLGAGTVRLDEAAISSLAGLGAGADFRVIFADSGPVLLVGADRYPATEP
jgi:hypothetical protein